jgi:WhiB family redox-sensing transcriptional regulator
MTAKVWPPRQGDPAALPGPEDWTELALCAEVGDDFWFPPKGGDPEPAKKVCRGCEVRATCLQYALDNEIRHGIWGGVSEQRRRAALQRGLTAAEAIAEDDERRMSKAQRVLANQERWREKERQQRAEARAMPAGSSAPAPQSGGEGGQFLTQVSAANAA